MGPTHPKMGWINVKDFLFHYTSIHTLFIYILRYMLRNRETLRIIIIKNNKVNLKKKGQARNTYRAKYLAHNAMVEVLE
jgi:hypothetical protein